MRQIGFVVLITLTIVGFTGGLSRAEVTLAPPDFSIDSQAMVPAQVPVLSQGVIGKSFILAQNTPQPNANQPANKQGNSTVTPTSDRLDNYQCLEYCTVVGQSCYGLALIQPDAKIAKIGSKENSKWSGECQNIEDNCVDKCNTDKSSVPWKRAKKNNNKKK